MMAASPSGGRAIPWLPLLASLGVVAGMIGGLRLEGRRWWCACGDPRLFIGQAWSPHTSQHLFDPYAFTHISHGLLLWGVLWFAARWITPLWRAVIALALEAAWEILENSSWIIERYRNATADIGYTGDSILNSLGDLVACGLGVAFAARFGKTWSLGALLILEMIPMLWIRDSLALNVLMLLTPIDAVRDWQMGR